MSKVIKSISLKEINDFLEISEDYISKLKLNDNKNGYYYSLTHKSGIEYNFFISINAYKYIIDCKDKGILENLKVEYEGSNDLGEDETGFFVKGKSVEILLPSENSLSEENEKMNKKFKERLKNYSPKPFPNINSDSNSKWGGLEGDEADLGFWNTD